MKLKRILLVFLISSITLVSFNGCKKKKSEYDETAPTVVEANDELKEDMIERPKLQEKLKSAKEKYGEDVVAWLHIPNTKIDYPVMQSTKLDFTSAAGSDPYYYSRHAENKNYRLEGSIFSFRECNYGSRKSLSRNTFIAGHNMENDKEEKMLAQLHKFLNIEFSHNNPYIFLSLPNGENLVFEIFAVYITEIPFTKYSKAGFLYHMSDYGNVKGGDGSLPVVIPDGKKLSYVQAVAKEAKLRSLYNYENRYKNPINRNDKIITLSTCTYKYGKTFSPNCEVTKFVVQGRLLPNSKKLYDKALLTKNKKPKAPQNLPNPNVNFVYECDGELIEDDEKLKE